MGDRGQKGVGAGCAYAYSSAWTFEKQKKISGFQNFRISKFQKCNFNYLPAIDGNTEKLRGGKVMNVKKFK